MTTLITKFEIPDVNEPIENDAPWGPNHRLVPFRPSPVDPKSVVGRSIKEMCTYVGTYGMGGPGFLGFRLDSDWLVVSLWGASSWITVNGRIIQDVFYKDTESPEPWITDKGNEIEAEIKDQKITELIVSRKEFHMKTENDLHFCLEKSSRNRPVHKGNGKARRLKLLDDLRKAVFISPTPEIWV